MKTICRLLLLSFLLLASVLHAQPSPQALAVRAAYAKVSSYNKAAYLQEMGSDAEWVVDSVALQFKLRNLRTGPISEILGQRWSDLVTPGRGEAISGVRGTSRVNEGPVQLTYAAEWAPGTYNPADDGRWTVGELFALSGENFRDVGTYVSYEVTVSLEGRSRTYKALALFHDLYDGGGRVEFADDVAGHAGEVTQLANETLAPWRAEPAASARSRVQSNAAAAHPRMTTNSTEEPFYLKDWSMTEHNGDGGSHGAYGTFTMPACGYLNESEQTCSISVTGQTFEEGGLVGYGLYHAVNWARDTQSSIGPLGSSISCGAAVAVAVKSCFIYCGVSVGVTYRGGTVTVSGASDALWSDKTSKTRTCALQPKVEGHGSCTGTGFQNVETDCETPIILDVDGDGYALTSAGDGVPFDLDSNGAPEQLSWTSPNDDDALLVLDRNGNGRIDDGRELFGNFTAQPESSNRNGFLALAELDRRANGGNEDGFVDAADAAFASLRLWRDANHDGISQSAELVAPAAGGVTRLHLAYKESRRVDEHGNAFRYRAKVDGAKPSDVARWAWDVFLVRQ